MLCLGDNMSMVLSIDRHRSKNFVVISLLRRISAYCLARNIKFCIRWIPSELNFSDEGSRLLDGGADKSRIRELEAILAQCKRDGVLPHGSDADAEALCSFGEFARPAGPYCASLVDGDSRLSCRAGSAIGTSDCEGEALQSRAGEGGERHRACSPPRFAEVHCLSRGADRLAEGSADRCETRHSPSAAADSGFAKYF